MTSSNSISIVVWEAELKADLIIELKKHFERVTTEPVAMVCLLGTNIDQPGLLAKATAALAKAEISVIATGAAKDKVNIQFLIAREDFRKVIIALNKELG